MDELLDAAVACLRGSFRSDVVHDWPGLVLQGICQRGLAARKRLRARYDELLHPAAARRTRSMRRAKAVQTRKARLFAVRAAPQRGM
jgi:hypothetical protein